MNTMDEGDIILGSNTINNQQSGEHLDTLNSNTDVVMNTNETFLSKNNTNIEKLLSLKMQIANELGGTDINFKIKGDRTLTLEDNKTFDIPGKITSIYKELNDMEDKANRASFSLHNNKNKKLGKEEEIITKSISEFKLSLMIKNKLNDEVKRPLDPNTLASNQNLLLRMIKNPNNHISEKTKSSMDRLLNNGFVDKDPVQITSPKKQSDRLSIKKMNSPIKKKKEDSIFGTFSPVKKSQTTIENKKSEILNILNNRDSVKNSNTSSNGGKVSSNQRIAAVLKNKESDDFIKKIVTSGETDGVMKKLKSMIPEITNSNRDFERKKTDISPANSSSVKIKRLDDQFSRMFKDKQK